MNRQQLKVMIKKEYKELVKEKGLLLSLLSMAIIFSIVLPTLILLVGTSKEMSASIVGLNTFLEQFKLIQVRLSSLSDQGNHTPLRCLDLLLLTAIYVAAYYVCDAISQQQLYWGEGAQDFGGPLIHAPIAKSPDSRKSLRLCLAVLGPVHAFLSGLYLSGEYTRLGLFWASDLA